MCFFLEQDSKRLIAPGGGIECFKVVCLTDRPGVYSAFYRCFLYRQSKQCPEIPLVVEKVLDEEMFVVEAGYHSYRSFESCLKLVDRWRTPLATIVRCLIPAGSQYYQNPDRDEYVSSSIILLGEES